ncbi:MAG: RDD family protein [Coriobacteriia bacterium]|nr:RDD family protein [Coriobacteriia bacterium]
MSDENATEGLFRVETPESVAFAYELAGLGSRGLALMLDSLLLGLLIFGEAALALGVVFALGLSTSELPGQAAAWIGGGFLVVAFATYWGYFIYGEGFRNGRTWGKRRMRIRVVRDDGSRIGAIDAVMRNLLRVVDVLPGNYAIGMVGVLLSARNKRLGDMVAGTVVVRDTGDDDLVFEGGGVEPAVLLARDFLDRRGGLTEPARAQVGIEVLRALGEEADPSWDEPTTAGRIADLCGWAERGVTAPSGTPDPEG